MTDFKPTLAATLDPMKEPDVFNKLVFPLWVSPKYDGIRGIGRDGALKSRTLLDLPSKQVQELFGHLTHFDGEVIAGDPCDGDDVYNRTQSIVMSKDKPHDDLRFYVFDWADEAWQTEKFFKRWVRLSEEVAALNRPDVIFVEQKVVHNLEEFLAAEEEYLAQGFEGIMARAPFSPYKHGRGTLGNPKKPKAEDQCLMKLKRFEDFEAQVTGFIEQMTNTNEAEKDELGHTKRSSAKDGLVPAGTLGKFIATWFTDYVKTKIEAEIPCGVIKHGQRKEIWDNQAAYLGRIIKVRHFPFGAKDGLRLPRCVGFRDPIDMGEPA